MIYSILKELESNNSRNFKIDLLNKHKDNLLLKEVCRLALDPMIQFYQRKIPVYTKMDGNLTLDLNSAIEGLSILSTRTLTGNAAIAQLQMILCAVTVDDAEVIKRIIGKDLKCGVSTSTVNKVWKDLVHEFPCMLCSPFDKKLVDKIQFPAIAQLKMDGMRVNAIVKNGLIEFRSRNGKEINLLGNLESTLLNMVTRYGQDIVLDGELLVLDTDGNISDRQTGNGILNKAVKGTISSEEAARVIMVVWDLISYEDFIVGKDKMAYSYRLEYLKDLVEHTSSNRIRLVESFDVDSLEQAQEIFQNYLVEGQEGIILKDPRSIWENKRSKSQIKFKAELDCDLRVVDIQEGTGKYVGMLGALLCESADGIVKVSVGSGFNDAQRKTIGSDIIGKIVSVKYNARIKNVKGEESLFLPVFLEERLDKETADTANKIK